MKKNCFILSVFLACCINLLASSCNGKTNNTPTDISSSKTETSSPAVKQASIVDEMPTSNLPDGSITVVWNEEAVEIDVANNLRDKVKANFAGAHVRVLIDESFREEVQLEVKGKSSNGSLFMDGKCPLKLVLSGLNLTNPDSAAINIQDGKSIEVALAEGTNNSLTDGLRGKDNGEDSHKAAFFMHGHATFTGMGTLEINGTVKHAYQSDEYTVLNHAGGTIKATSDKADAFHVKQYLQIQSGTLNTIAGGSGIDVSKTKSETDKQNGQLIFEDGMVWAISNGKAGKAMKVESDFFMKGGKLAATAFGEAYYDAKKEDIASAAAVKCNKLQMSGGEMTLFAKGDGGKGLNTDGDINITAGKVHIVTTGGKYEYDSETDTKPHGIKCDGDITLAGGEVSVAVESKKATSIKTDWKILTNGAQVIAIGGKSFKTSGKSTHESKTGKVNISGGGNITFEGVSMNLPTDFNREDAFVLISK